MAWWLFQNVVVTTALAAMAVMVCRATRLGPVARHALWVLVLVKFVTPPLVVWPWAAPDPLGVAAFDAHVDAGLPPLPRRDADVPVAVLEIDGPRAPISSDGRVIVEPGQQRVVMIGAAALPWVLGVWAAGSVCLLALESVRVVRLARRVRRAPPADVEIVRRVTALATRLGVRPVPVRAMTGAASPVVWCLGRPILLWPAELPADSTDACIDGLIVHELAHVNRRDHLVGWVELAASVVWWWNPLFWFVRSSRREQAELACDAWVISALPNGRRAYAESLLALSAAAPDLSSASMAVIGVRASSRRVLERRLIMVMQGRAPLRLSMVGFLSLALAAAATLPAWATGQQAQPPPPPVPVVTPAVPAPPAPPAPLPAKQKVSVPVKKAPATVLDEMVGVKVPPGATKYTVFTSQTPPPPPPPTPQKAMTRVRVAKATLPAEGGQLIDRFETDRETIQKEADQKIAALRESAVKALEALQDQYAKAGKLDEAVAIRDYLRAGNPVNQFRFERSGTGYIIRR